MGFFPGTWMGFCPGTWMAGTCLGTWMGFCMGTLMVFRLGISMGTSSKLAKSHIQIGARAKPHPDARAKLHPCKCPGKTPSRCPGKRARAKPALALAHPDARAKPHPGPQAMPGQNLRHDRSPFPFCPGKKKKVTPTPHPLSGITPPPFSFAQAFARAMRGQMPGHFSRFLTGISFHR